jgi:hypothetical protein
MAQTTSFGTGGWVRLDDPEMPGPVYLRYRSDGGRAVLTEFYIDGRDREIPTGLFRKLDLAGFTAWAMHGMGEWLEVGASEPAPDLSRLASYWKHRPGPARKDWIADSFRAQSGEGPVKQPPFGHEPGKVEHKPSRPDPVKAPKNGLTDDFLGTVADNYVWAVRNHERPAVVIAAQTGYQKRTVSSWIMKARDRGLLMPTTQGKVG